MFLARPGLTCRRQMRGLPKRILYQTLDSRLKRTPTLFHRAAAAVVRLWLLFGPPFLLQAQSRRQLESHPRCRDNPLDRCARDFSSDKKCKKNTAK